MSVWDTDIIINHTTSSLSGMGREQAFVIDSVIGHVAQGNEEPMKKVNFFLKPKYENLQLLTIFGNENKRINNFK